MNSIEKLDAYEMRLGSKILVNIAPREPNPRIYIGSGVHFLYKTFLRC